MKAFVGYLLAGIFVTLPAYSAEVKKARANDVVDQYILDDDSRLIRKIGNLECAVTNRVQDFKISMHPNDLAMAYFIKEGNLYEIHHSTPARKGECPKAEVVLAMRDIAKVDGQYKYNVVSSTNTKIVNMALDRHGNLHAWDNVRLVLSMNGVTDYKMNTCNDQPGAAFSKYVAFAEDSHGRIMKLDGDKPDSSKFSPESYRFSGNAIRDFKQREGVCVTRHSSLQAPLAPEASATAL